MLKEPTKGIVYIACDSKKYIDETIISAKSFKQYCDSIHISLYTDIPGVKNDCFNRVIDIENLIPGGNTSREWTEGKYYFTRKIDILSRSPYEMSLYLDCDVVAVADIEDMFDLLGRFDIAMSHGENRYSEWSEKLNIPKCFPDYNGGIILYRKSTTKKFFKAWRENFELHPQPHDQTSLRKTLWEEEVKIATLPPEYNIRPIKFHHKQDPKILHGRGKGFLINE